MKTRHDRGADREADAEAERDDLALELERGELELEVHDRARALRDLLDRRAEALANQSRGWAWPLQSIHFARTMPAARATPTTIQGSGPPPLSSWLGRLPSCGLDGATRRASRLLVRRRLALRPRLDQARLHLADEVGVLGERLGELSLDPAFAGEIIRDLLQLVRGTFDLLIRRCHFFVGGSSPVSVRQMRVAVRRDTIVASAARAPERADQSSLRSMQVHVLPSLPPLETLHAYARCMQLAKLGAASPDRERRLAETGGDPVRAAGRSRRLRLRRHAGHDLAGHPGARAREDARPVRTPALHPAERDPAQRSRGGAQQHPRAVRPQGDARRATSSSCRASSGAAPAIARALDQLGHERVVGTLAGDDTVLVVAPTERDARRLARELAATLG